jgi:hypothetical protein
MICPRCHTEQSAFTQGFGYSQICLTCFWQLADNQDMPYVITVTVPKNVPYERIVIKFTRED